MIVLRKMLQHYGKLKMIKINPETIKNNALYKKRKIYQKINIISAHKYESKIYTEGLIYAVN